MAVEASAARLYGAGPHPIWFTDTFTSLAGATRGNSRKTCALDTDDGHRLVSGHIGGGVVCAVLTLAQSIEVSWNRIVMAIAVGYNVAIVAGQFANLVDDTTLASGRWCSVAVAGALGYLEKCTVEQLAQALAIAAHTTNGRLYPTGTKFPHHTKEGIPEAAVSGLNAHEDARHGGLGPLDIMDLLPPDKRFAQDAMLEIWHALEIYFKRFGCCRYLHALLDAMLKVREDIKDLSEIDSILLESFSRTLGLRNHLEPQSVEDAQFSTEYCAALALVHGLKGACRMSPVLLKDRTVLAWAKKMVLREDQNFTGRFPAEVPGRVTVTLRDRSPDRQYEVSVPKGDPRNPLSWEDREEKLLLLARSTVGDELVKELREAFVSLRNHGDIKALFGCLGKKATA